MQVQVRKRDRTSWRLLKTPPRWIKKMQVQLGKRVRMRVGSDPERTLPTTAWRTGRRMRPSARILSSRTTSTGISAMRTLVATSSMRVKSTAGRTCGRIWTSARIRGSPTTSTGISAMRTLVATSTEATAATTGRSTYDRCPSEQDDRPRVFESPEINRFTVLKKTIAFARPGSMDYPTTDRYWDFITVCFFEIYDALFTTIPEGGPPIPI